jgi:early secretory antigenic target protein ESAT-6
MTDQLTVDFGAMHQAAEDINSAISNMRSQLDELDTAAKPLVTTWSGEAQTAYQQRHQTWTNAANDLEQILRQIQKAMVDSTDDYQQTETSNVTLFRPV